MNLMIADEYMDELLKYEYESKMKRRGHSSILVTDMVKKGIERAEKKA